MDTSGYIQILAKDIRFGEVFTAGPFNHEIVESLIRAELDESDSINDPSPGWFIFAVSNLGNAKKVYALDRHDIVTVWR